MYSTGEFCNPDSCHHDSKGLEHETKKRSVWSPDALVALGLSYRRKSRVLYRRILQP